MLGAGIAAAVSKHLSHSSIYTAKLLRRGIDIERPQASHVPGATRAAEANAPGERRKSATLSV